MNYQEEKKVFVELCLKNSYTEGVKWLLKNNGVNVNFGEVIGIPWFWRQENQSELRFNRENKSYYFNFLAKYYETQDQTTKLWSRFQLEQRQYSLCGTADGEIVNKQFDNIGDAMRFAMDFVENGESVKVTDNCGTSYDPLTYWD